MDGSLWRLVRPATFRSSVFIHYLLESGLADEVRIIPCNDHPLGKRLSPFAQRAECAKPSSSHFTAERWSIRSRQELPIPSYSYQTAEALAAAFPDDELRWVIGADAAEQLDQWMESKRLTAVAPLLVVGRQGERSTLISSPSICQTSQAAEIRQAACQGESLNGFVPHAIRSAARRGSLLQ